MARLSDLFVSVRADDSQASKVIKGVRSQLQSVDKTKVQPQITLPEKVQADIAGLSSKLTALGRTQVKLNVDSATVAADVKTLERQLANLRAKKTTLPVDLQDGAQREINALEQDLFKAQRKQTRIPLQLERVDAQVSSVRGALETLSKTVDIPVDVDAKDARSKAEKAGRSAGEGFGTSFGGAAKSLLAGAFAYVGLSEAIGFFKDANAEAREAQKVGAVTESVIRATGGAAKISAEQVGALATAISNKTGQDDEAIQTGANLLLTFKQVRNEAGKGSDIFNQATQAATDLAAAGFGSVEGASKLLGKALNDPIKGMSALSRAGVTFTAEQKKVTKALIEGGDVNALVALGVIDSATEFNIQLKRNGGDVKKTVDSLTSDLTKAQKKQFEYYTEGGHFVEAQKTILTEVKSQVGGVAEASATAGEKAKVAFGNLKEQIGTALLPAVDAVARALAGKIIPAVSAFVAGIQSGTGPGGKFAEIMRSVGSAISKVGKFISDNREVVGAFVGILGGAAAAFKVLTAVTAAFNIVAAANPIGLIVVGLAALVAGLIYAYKHSESFRKVVDTVGRALKTAFVVALASVKVAIAAIVKAFIAVRDTTVEVWATVKGAVVGAWQGIVAFFSGAGAAVSGAVGAVWERVKAVTVGTFTAVAIAVSDGWGKVVKFTTTLLAPVVAVVKGIIGGFVTVFKVAFTAIGVLNVLFWGAISKVTSAAFTAVKDKVITPIWASVSAIFTKVQDTISKAFGKFWGGIKSVATTAFVFYRDKIITPVWNKVSSIFSTVQTAITTAFTKFWTGIKSIATTAFVFYRDKIVLPIWTKVTSLFSTAQTAISKAFTAFWTTIKTTATTYFTAIKTTIDNALGKVKGYFSTAQTKVSTAWTGFWTGIKSTAGTAIDKVKEKVDTVLGKIKGSFDTAKTNIKTAWNGIKSVVSAPIEWVKNNVYNQPLVPVWNRVAALVNGPKLSAYARGGIAEAERFANGGTPFGVRPGYTPGRDTHTIQVGGGEAIMRPEWTRAVGAEYVAQANKAARTGGAGAVRDFMLNRSDPLAANTQPMDAFAGGGIVGWIKSTVGGAVGGIKDLAGTLKDFAVGGLKKAANAVLAPVRGLIRRNLSGAAVRETVGNVANKALDLVVGKIGTEDDKAATTGGGIGPIDVNNPRGRTTFRGGTFTNLMAANLKRAEQIAKVTIPAIQGGFRPTTSYSGTSHQGDAIDTNVNYAALRALRQVGIAAGDRTGLGNWAPHIHAVPLPGHGFGAGSAVWQAQDYLRRGGAKQSPRSPWGLAEGGLVRGGRGGVTTQIGEGKFDELVTPLPRNWQAKGDAKMDQLLALLEARGAGTVEINLGGIHNPLPETASQTTNRVLQRVSSLGLV